jgi:fucose permease
MTPTAPAERNVQLIKWLTCLMFLMFAMTTDAVGTVIPRVIDEYKLSMTAASAFHWVTMAAIALGAILLGFLADRIGRKTTILLGLLCYGIGSLLFAFGNTFGFFVALLAISGVGIAVFKIGAIALIGDISASAKQHTATMNLAEGFFGVGAMIGPAIVTALLTAGLSWKYLYVTASIMCAVLMIIALGVRYPTMKATTDEPINLARTLRMMKNPYALGFSLLIMLYVATEVAIYVWMPTLLKDYSGPAAHIVAYALTTFFVLRAAGRFLGVWMLSHFRWSTVLMWFGCAIFACFAASLVGGRDVAAWLLPLSGLFMSVMYPTINSKGISCFEKSEHGAVAGVILFFTAAAAAAAPPAMGFISDQYGDIRYGFVLATVFAALLAFGLFYNWWRDPAAARLAALDRQQAQA